MDECNVKNCVRKTVDGELCREHVIDPADFKPIPNRAQLRANGLTLLNKRRGYFRRQLIKRTRSDKWAEAGYEPLGS